MDECAGIFMERMDEFVDTKESIDFHYWLQCYAFDVIGQITFGKRFGKLHHAFQKKSVSY